MSDTDYLWNRTGAVDPEVERLERLLSPYGHRRGLRPLPGRDRGPTRQTRRIFHALQGVAVAASLTLVVSAWWLGSAARSAGWAVRAIQGMPSIAGTRVAGTSRLPRGETLTTDAAGRAEIAVDDIGTVVVDPNSRVRVLRADAGERRLALDRGRIHARIAAPPRSFAVTTPIATAIDLGCAYTLEVNEDGWGQLQVDIGWVAFAYGGHESFIPHGAVCQMGPGFGPGTPHYADSPPALTEALTILDFSSTKDVRREMALDAVLATARRRDAFTLWHLLSRVSAQERPRVYDRLAALVPPPAGVTREDVVRGDSQALDVWWDSLGLQSASWWRLWKAPWGG